MSTRLASIDRPPMNPSWAGETCTTHQRLDNQAHRVGEGPVVGARHVERANVPNLIIPLPSG
eukprot:2614894-Pyramimonas_sp.AAC.1